MIALPRLGRRIAIEARTKTRARMKGRQDFLVVVVQPIKQVHLAGPGRGGVWPLPPAFALAAFPRHGGRGYGPGPAR